MAKEFNAAQEAEGYAYRYGLVKELQFEHVMGEKYGWLFVLGRISDLTQMIEDFDREKVESQFENNRQYYLTAGNK